MMSNRDAQTQKLIQDLHAELMAADEGSEYDYDSDYSGIVNPVDFNSVPSSLQQPNYSYSDSSSSDDETDDERLSDDTLKTIYFQTGFSADPHHANFLKEQLSSKYYAMDRKAKSTSIKREAGGGVDTTEISETKQSVKKDSVKKSLSFAVSERRPQRPLTTVPSIPHFFRCTKTCWVPEVRVGSTTSDEHRDLFYQKATLAYLRTRALCREKLRYHKPQPRRKRKSQYNAPQLLTCKFCLKEFKIKSLLDAHKLSHEPGRHEYGRPSVQIEEPKIIIQKPKQQCQYCDKTFALEFMLHIHQMKYCLRIPLPVRRTLQYSELDHKKPPPTPSFMASGRPKTRGSILKPSRRYAPVELE